jgi:CheY-like chemotaxis protein
MENNLKYNTVMIVDDNKIDAILNKKIIEKEGFAETVLVQNSASKTIDFLGSEVSVLPSLIFVDMMMPDMNGFEFLDAFEKLPSTVVGKIKIVFMSGSMLSQDQLQRISLNKNVLKFIPKPINKASLDSLLSIG